MKILSIANVKTKFLVNMNNFSYDININPQPDIAIDSIILITYVYFDSLIAYFDIFVIISRVTKIKF